MLLVQFPILSPKRRLCFRLCPSDGLFRGLLTSYWSDLYDIL